MEELLLITQLHIITSTEYGDVRLRKREGGEGVGKGRVKKGY